MLLKTNYSMTFAAYFYFKICWRMYIYKNPKNIIALFNVHNVVFQYNQNILIEFQKNIYINL